MYRTYTLAISTKSQNGVVPGTRKIDMRNPKIIPALRKRYFFHISGFLMASSLCQQARRRTWWPRGWWRLNGSEHVLQNLCPIFYIFHDAGNGQRGVGWVL